MSGHSWEVQVRGKERVAICRDGTGAIVSQWLKSPVGYVIRNAGRYGPPWVRPKYPVPAMVAELLGDAAVTA